MRLDVGCGANPQGDVNVDLYPINSPDHCKVKYVGSDHPNFVRADAHHLPFRNDLFDEVLLDNILEHCLRPFDTLVEACRVATNVINIFVPATEYSDELTPGHICSWTQHSLLHLLNLLSGNVKIEKLPHPSSGLMQIRAVMRVDS